MDLNTIQTVLRPSGRDELPVHAAGDAFLAGGTWLFSEPQRDLTRLVDLQALGWPAIVMARETLSIGATCTLEQLERFANEAGWPGSALVRECCRALWGSFKIWNAATVGGNLCLALPAAPMAALLGALDGNCVVWRADGRTGSVAAPDFIRAPQVNCLQPGDMLRQIDIPTARLHDRYAVRQASLTVEGRSAALLVGRADGNGMVLTVTASVPRPLRLTFETMPDRASLALEIDDAASTDGWYHDVHGAPDWRRHMTLRLADEIRRELSA
ncbi:FAD-binding molybdopterin dehydrogenase [Lichenicola cladoniae]|uniref:FAD-binding molybdopterin dehydrogenase n=1 Tax=Lichenicola cladoniae TaxID=1484109 RepID=A0A6M8HRA9_9PROT|nr:FAD binding domain-containing protein [Lichenicola cladoniae]NPD66012.1 FAD-binding molybdopterin dehydrogenase [Acetobacteraceae bacterium]QKE91009.1 FAD-binding molybdopterin dehydrogenase [Lichenicola cladoniae]